MIQGSINQLLSMATIAAKLDPGSEKRAAVYQKEQTINKANKLYSEVYKPALLTEPSIKGKTEIMEDISKQGADVVAASEELLKLDPTKEHYNALRANRQMKSEADELVAQGKKILSAAEKKEQATQKAREALIAEQERIKRSRAVSKRDPALGANLGGNL